MVRHPTVKQKPTPVGNGSREKLITYFSKYNSHSVDHLLMWLWAEGYRVVPHPVARRAKKYNGPTLIGSTHTARLAQNA